MQIEGWDLIKLGVVSSTNDAARASSKDFSGRPIVFIAASQTAGRGRMGRRWISSAGNLFMSQLFSLQEPLSDLVFITSLSIADTIKNLTSGLDIKIKWPNDVLVAGAKISGILIENGEHNTVIVGVGINLVSSPQDENILYKVTDLKSLGFDIKRELFLQTYLKHFNANLQDCRRRGFAGIRQRWINYAYRLNASIMICQSSKTQTGIFKGIDEQGFLLLEHNGEISKIAAGDVFVPSKG